MTLIGWFQIILYCAIVVALVKPLGWYMTRVFNGERTVLSAVLRPVEAVLYRIGGVDEKREQHWLTYTVAMLLFHVGGFLILYALLRLQAAIPLWNPADQSAVAPDLSFNTAVSFITNTNWQNYGGESTLSYLVQMLGLTHQNFLSAATGMVLAVALIQLASRLTGLTVIATASRPETREWCLKLGAHHVVDHSKALSDELKAIGHPQVALIAGLTGTEQHYPAIVEIIAPQGKFALIDDPASLDATKLKSKSASLHWEAMFTRSTFGTPDMVAQHRLLNEVAALVDAGVIVTTLAEELSPINAANLRRAHALVESGRSRGKVVVTGW
jgi:NADPH:quinone reductase-like Zn-dependent oxidoreductase